MTAPTQARLLSWPQLVVVQFMLTIKNRRWMELIGGAIGLQTIALLVVAAVDRANAHMLGPAWAVVRAASLQRIDLGTWVIGLIMLAAMWPTFLWRNESPLQRLYHWSLPAERGSHELARVAAGGIWVLLVAAIVFFVATIWLPLGHPHSSIASWIPQFTMVLLAAYGLGSVAALSAERPGLWILGTIALSCAAVGFLTMTPVDEDLAIIRLLDELLMEDAGLVRLFATTVDEPGSAPWVWLTVAIVGLAVVTRRRTGGAKLTLRRAQAPEPT